MAAEDLDDDYVANLLKEDAKTTAKKYDLVGLDAFIPKKRNERAPKPNTRFLRHIIRETDNHNAALLAKEAEESRSRLKQLERESDRHTPNSGRLTPPILTDDERDRKRKRSDYKEDEERRSKRRDRDRDSKHHRSSRERDRDNDRDRRSDRRREGRRYEESDDGSGRPSRHSKHHRDERRRKDRYSNDESEGRPHRNDGDKGRRRHRRQRSLSRHSRSRSRSPSRSHHQSSRHKRGRRSPSTDSVDSKSRSAVEKSAKSTHLSKRRSQSPASDSDPLEAIVGPLPPPKAAPIRSRGRGAHKSTSAMDERFSSTYDPSIDVRPPSDVDDDFGDALEAFRDRQKMKQHGAERLRAAGFTEEQVKRWEKGGEKTEEDVVWSMKGQAREWDRGKVVDEDGHVDLKADWGRLK